MKAIIFEGNTDERIDRVIETGSIPCHQNFANVIQSLNPNIKCEYAFPTRADYELIGTDELKGYDFVFWTGSSLNAYDDMVEVTNQIKQAELVFESGTPFYGSCWGLQIAVMASGGMVAPSKNGYEFGVAKDIIMTDAGANHPMLKGRENKPYASFCVHNSETTVIPDGATLLASNKHSNVQALEIKHNGGIFWGVQYHPEFDRKRSYQSMKRSRNEYERLGLIDTNKTNEQIIDDMISGWENDLTTDIRLIEIENFINHFSA
ncbi:MAG: type 1 glutamine amidotransferase [Alphaproteobacteria bacterium]